MKRKIAFERHCGYWPLPKQTELFDRLVLLPRGPEPMPSREVARVLGIRFVPMGPADSSDLEVAS